VGFVVKKDKPLYPMGVLFLGLYAVVLGTDALPNHFQQHRRMVGFRERST
jgi:hypothetical protein